MEADELLLLVAGGDQMAFEELYGLVAGPVFGLVRRVVRDPAQSEEVSQEVLLETWRSAARFDPAGAARCRGSSPSRTAVPSTGCAAPAPPVNASSARHAGPTTPPSTR